MKAPLRVRFRREKAPNRNPGLAGRAAFAGHVSREATGTRRKERWLGGLPRQSARGHWRLWRVRTPAANARTAF